MSQQKQSLKVLEKTRMDDFQIIKKLGQGAYSSVFKVRRKTDGQLYALKKVKMKNLSTKQKQNSLNQVRILASIQHQHVISYKQAFFESQCLFIIMEYADGGDLFNEITSKKKKGQIYKQQQIWSVFLQICTGLHSLHNLKIIHRDLKSANVFVNKNREIKLGDMNVSKVGELCVTQTGTPYYASPQIWKDLPYDFKSDLWSLGCILYQMITFEPPFKGVDMEDLYENIVMGNFQPIPSSYSQNLKLMIDSLLQKIPIKRPSTQYILDNIEEIVPESSQSNPIIKNLIKKYSKKNRKSRQNHHVNVLMKTIQFPNRKKKKMIPDSQLTSYLPSPSYSKSQRTSKSINQSSLFSKDQVKSKHDSVFIPIVNISMDQPKRKKLSQKPKKKQKQRNSLLQKENNRLILPAIQNKRIYRRAI